ncbi:MAG: glycosyltransferase [Candidatus Sungbacteria bacterium]|nr:glycosyltransferase [Candidatus Sungbacteria bacterium]
MPNKKIQASVYILTKNSARTLRRVLESVKDFEDIVVCDGGSGDDTLSIARSCGANVFLQPKECLTSEGYIADFACIRTDCMNHAKFDWVLYVDSDEAASPGLVQEIRSVVEESAAQIFDVYEVPTSYQRIDGRMIRYSSNFPGYQRRFFTKKFGAYFYKSPHSKIRYREKGDSDIKVGRFTNPWINFMPDGGYWRRFWGSNRKFMELELSRMSSLSRIERWRLMYNSFRPVLGIGFRAFRNYIFHGFKDSMPISAEAARIAYHLILGVRIFLSIF